MRSDDIDNVNSDAPVADAPEHRSSSLRKAVKVRWSTKGDYECSEGVWRGDEFVPDPEMVMWVTEYVANNGGTAHISEQVRDDTGERRVTIRIVLAS